MCRGREEMMRVTEVKQDQGEGARAGGGRKMGGGEYSKGTIWI